MRMSPITAILVLVALTGCTSQRNSQKNSAVARFTPQNSPSLSTYSIVAFDPDSGDLGVAVQSRFCGVGPVVPWVESGVGAIATQSYPNTSFGPRGLELLRGGKSAGETLDALVKSDELRERRQVAIVDTEGHSAVHTGNACFAWAGGKTGKHYSVQGNILVSKATVDAMAAAFESSSGEELAERLMRALEAGQRAGGDVRGRQSAAMRVARRGAGIGGNDRYVWLDVQDHPRPVQELRRLLDRQFGKDTLSRARVARFRGRHDEARQLYLEAERLEPENAQILIERAAVEFTAGKGELAEKTIEKALALDPHYDNLLYQSGRLLLGAGKLKKAVTLLEKLVDKTPAYRDRLKYDVTTGNAPFFEAAAKAIREAGLIND